MPQWCQLMASLRIGPAAAIEGRYRPPSDKSLTHRALMFGAIAAGVSRVRNPLGSEDAGATRRCLEAMGLRVEAVEDGWLLHPSEWHTPEGVLDCGNSGTTMRLLSGLIASRPLTATLAGDASLSRRPMGRIAEPLRLMGARVEGDRPPITIHGGGLRGIRYATPVASAQIKSCILLAGLRAEGTTTVEEETLTRDHTERMLAACGVSLDRHRDGERHVVSVHGGQTVQPFDFAVPADISSAAFFMVAAALLPAARLTLEDVGVNPARTGILDVLDQAGVKWFAEAHRDQMGEPVADLTIHDGGDLRPFEIGGGLVPRLIDEIPVLAVLATQCDGVSVIRDAQELRVKESDRIERVAEGLRAMGARVETREDGMEIEGPVQLRGATIQTDGDHRIGMAFAVAGLIAQGETVVEGSEAIQTSFPTFAEDLWKLTYA